MKVGIVGTGHMGNVHASKYAEMTGVSLTAYDRDTEKLTGFCARHSAEPAPSLQALLATSDAIDVCLPTHLHMETVLQALESRVPTLVEKPFALTLDQCRQMIDARDRAQTPLAVAHVCRFFPEHRLVHNLVKQGRVGNVGAVRMRRGGKAPVGSDRWFQDHSQSGGVLLDLAVHEFDWLLWTLGPVERVFARSVSLSNPQPGLTGDYALTTLKFVSGAVAHVESTWMDPSGFRTTIDVAGSEGNIEFDSRAEVVLRVHTSEGSTARSDMAPNDDPYQLQAKAFLQAVQTGSPLPATSEDGFNAVAVALAAIESATTGKPVAPQTAAPLG